MTTVPGADARVATSLVCRWHGTIDAIAEQAWDRCFATMDVRKSYALQKAVEDSHLEGIDYHYLCIENAAVVVAIFPCFTFKISLTTVAPERVNEIVSKVRKYFPGFLFINSFVVGTPIAICESLIGVDEHRVNDDALEHLLAVANEQIRVRSVQLRAGLVLIKEFPAASLNLYRSNLFRDFLIAESPATTYLYVGEPGISTYMGRLRNKYRSAMRIRLRNFRDSGLEWVRSDDFARYADRMHELYLEVRSRSSVQFETLTPLFFRTVSGLADGRSFALLCFAGDRLVAFELFLKDVNNLYPVYLGMDYRYRDTSSLYFNCIYRIIREAEDTGKRVIELGQTSYEAKALLGAVAARLYLAVRHNNRLLHLLISLFKQAIFPPTQIPSRHRTFTSMEEAYRTLQEWGVPLEEKGS